jgi:hypothetical protein
MINRKVATILLFILLIGVVLITTNGSVWIHEVDTETTSQTRSLRTAGLISNATTEGGYEITITILGPGDYPVDFRSLNITWVGPNRNYTLTPAPKLKDTANLSGTHFAYSVVVDDNGSAPIMDSVDDKFNIIIKTNTFTNINSSKNISIIINVPEINGQTYRWSPKDSDSLGSSNES